MEDREIIHLLRERPAEGLRHMMDKYHPLVRTVVGRVLPHHPQDAEECIEDAFVAVWRRRGELDPESKTLKGFLMVTARNGAISRYRLLAKTRPLNIEELDPAGEEDVAATVLDAQATRELQALILAMKEPDKEIFFRKYFLFESYRQIARRTGLEEDQVRNRLYYGRKKLRRQLEERGYGFEAIG